MSPLRAATSECDLRQKWALRVSGTRYQFKVSGDSKVRARGELAFVLPQALDLVSRSAYTATISETEYQPPGILRLRDAGHGNITAQYEPNPNRSERPRPAWLDLVPNLSRQLGKQIQWKP